MLLSSRYTLFDVVKAGGEILSPAKMLFKGAQVVAANGTPVEVVQPPEQHRVDAVIELKADQSFLVVSPDHRILIPGNKTVLGQSCKGCEGGETHVCMLRGLFALYCSNFPCCYPDKSSESPAVIRLREPPLFLCEMRSDSNAVSFRPTLAQVQAKEHEVGSEVILDGTQAKLTSMDS